MKATSQRAIEVWAAWAGLEKPILIGVLTSTPVRGREVFAFSYDAAWLQSDQSHILDPALQLFSGPQYPPEDRNNFGLFLDSSPDRWGRLLMDRREAQAAREAGRPRQSLRESDYLLGVYDGHRMGGLRFRTEPEGPFLDDNREFASPPWASLRELEQASLEIERVGVEKNPNYKRWLHMLIAPGGSLGGARPKAGVMDEQGRLWIAKFPSRNDPVDRGGWEMMTHSLARRAGVTVSDAEARTFNTSRHTFLTRRFDRTEEGSRVHFASAMTLLGRKDGDDASNGASYLELAEFLMKAGAQADRDLEELWRRIVFNICVSNADDPLQNHGFLLEPGGWALSPAYDMNPDPDAYGLMLNISDVENALDLELARDVAIYFRVTAVRAKEVIEEVVAAVRTWQTLASELKLTREEVGQMEAAFRAVDSA